MTEPQRENSVAPSSGNLSVSKTTDILTTKTTDTASAHVPNKTSSSLKISLHNEMNDNDDALSENHHRKPKFLKEKNYSGSNTLDDLPVMTFNHLPEDEPIPLPVALEQLPTENDCDNKDVDVNESNPPSPPAPTSSSTLPRSRRSVTTATTTTRSTSCQSLPDEPLPVPEVFSLHPETSAEGSIHCSDASTNTAGVGRNGSILKARDELLTLSQRRRTPQPGAYRRRVGSHRRQDSSDHFVMPGDPSLSLRLENQEGLAGTGQGRR